MKTMIKFFGVLFLALYASQFAYSQDENLTSLKFFKIYVTTSDDELFTLVQDDMGIDPKISSYVIFVDIRSDEDKNKYIVLGDIGDSSSMKFGWGQFSKKVQDGLIAWNKPNKMSAE